MIRALYTAASGMAAQQNNIDVISNNISNVETPGFKKSNTLFKDTLYDAMDINRPEPVNLQVGNGVKVGSLDKSFTQGNIHETNNPMDIAIQGAGFFKLQSGDGIIRYTRDGSFKIAPQFTPNGIVQRLVTAEGYYVVDRYTGQPLEFNLPYQANPNDVVISQEGFVFINDPNGNAIPIGGIDVVQFANPNALEDVGGNMYALPPQGTELTGEEMQSTSILKQGYLEGSNVQLFEEMTDLIMAQRAYQLNSRVLQSADEIERLANNVRD